MTELQSSGLPHPPRTTTVPVAVAHPLNDQIWLLRQLQSQCASLEEKIQGLKDTIKSQAVLTADALGLNLAAGDRIDLAVQGVPQNVRVHVVEVTRLDTKKIRAHIPPETLKSWEKTTATTKLEWVQP